jgi:hypothetical protein
VVHDRLCEQIIERPAILMVTSNGMNIEQGVSFGTADSVAVAACDNEKRAQSAVS